MSFKRFFVCMVIIFSLIDLNAQVTINTNVPKFQTAAVPLSLRKSPIIKIDPTFPNVLENSASGRSMRGKILEPIAKEIYKSNFGSKFQYVDATYHSGSNGIDGLLIKKNWRGSITKVHIVEVKSGNASLHVNSKLPQLSKEWILDRIDKSIAEKTKILKKLQKSMKKKDLPSTVLKENRKGFSRINRERRNLKKTRINVVNDNFERFLVDIQYKNGCLTVEQTEILGENPNYKNIPRNKRKPNDIFKWGETKTLAKFSFLDIDDYKLNSFQRQVKNTMFKEFEQTLRKYGYTEAEVQSYMYKLRTDGNFNPSKNGFGDESFKQIAEKSIDKVNKSYVRQQNVIKGGIITLAVISEGKALYDWRMGSISTADFVFNTTLNMASVVPAFIEKLNPYMMTAIFICIDVVKNAYNIKTGKIKREDGIINVAANISGLGAGVAASIALGSAKIGGAIGTFIGTPIGGVIIGGAFVAVTIAIVKWTGHTIVNYFEAIKEPKRFNLMLIDIRKKYDL